MSSGVALGRNDLDGQAKRLGERRGGLLRALEFGGVDSRDLRVLQRRRQRFGPSPARVRQVGIRGHRRARAWRGVRALGVAHEKDRRLRRRGRGAQDGEKQREDD